MADTGEMGLAFSHLFSGLIISCAGMGFFLYGKRQQRLWPLLAGIAMCLYPFFVENFWVLWLLTAALLGGLYYLREP